LFVAIFPVKVKDDVEKKLASSSRTRTTRIVGVSGDVVSIFYFLFSKLLQQQQSLGKGMALGQTNLWNI